MRNPLIEATVWLPVARMTLRKPAAAAGSMSTWTMALVAPRLTTFTDSTVTPRSGRCGGHALGKVRPVAVTSMATWLAGVPSEGDGTASRRPVRPAWRLHLAGRGAFAGQRGDVVVDGG